MHRDKKTAQKQQQQKQNNHICNKFGILFESTALKVYSRVFELILFIAFCDWLYLIQAPSLKYLSESVSGLYVSERDSWFSLFAQSYTYICRRNVIELFAWTEFAHSHKLINIFDVFFIGTNTHTHTRYGAMPKPRHINVCQWAGMILISIRFSSCFCLPFSFSQRVHFRFVNLLSLSCDIKYIIKISICFSTFKKKSFRRLQIHHKKYFSIYIIHSTEMK